MAAQLHDTLYAKLSPLPDELEIFPGHQAGSACGVGRSGKSSSTFGFEKRWNPRLSKAREELAAGVSVVSPKPAEMERMSRVNRAITV